MTIKCPSCKGVRITRNGSSTVQSGLTRSRFQCRECYRTFYQDGPNEGAKEGYLDIEASGLVGNFAHMICWAIKTRGGKVFYDVLRSRTLGEEKRILQALLDQLNSYNRIYTYYGARFDVPFVRTRCEYHGLDFPPYMTMYHIDVYDTVKHKFSLHSKRLQVAESFLLKEQNKTPLHPDIWVKASFGDRKAFKYILDHNIADVEVLERLHNKVEKYMRPGARRSL